MSKTAVRVGDLRQYQHNVYYVVTDVDADGCAELVMFARDDVYVRYWHTIYCAADHLVSPGE